MNVVVVVVGPHNMRGSIAKCDLAALNGTHGRKTEGVGMERRGRRGVRGREDGLCVFGKINIENINSKRSTNCVRLRIPSVGV